jgi:hypothetical protein
MSKLKTDKIVQAMKDAAKILKAKPIAPIAKKEERKERDMRQEAIDMGSYGAQEYFGINDEDVSNQ